MCGVCVCGVGGSEWCTDVGLVVLLMYYMSTIII